MSNLTFYFDPLCPWTWRTSLWIREVQRQTDLAVEWKFFSLAEANNGPDPLSRAPLRAEVLARREGGNAAVDRLYLTLGKVIHESGFNVWKDGMPKEAVSKALGEAGFSPNLLEEAMADESTLADLLTEHRGAVEQYKAYGSPWLIVDDSGFGFNGPIIDAVPTDETALKLWEHLSWTLTQPYFYELKRNRG